MQRNNSYTRVAIDDGRTKSQLFNDNGVICYRFYNYDEALKNFTLAISEDNKNAEAYANRGMAYCMSDELELALQDYNRAFELGLTGALLYNSLGYVYEKLNDYQNAINNYDIAIDRARENKAGDKYNFLLADCYCNRACAYYFGKKNFKQAQADFARAIAADPNISVIYNWQGEIYQLVERA